MLYHYDLQQWPSHLLIIKQKFSIRSLEYANIICKILISKYSSLFNLVYKHITLSADSGNAVMVMNEQADKCLTAWETLVMLCMTAFLYDFHRRFISIVFDVTKCSKIVIIAFVISVPLLSLLNTACTHIHFTYNMAHESTKPWISHASWPFARG